MSQPDEKSPNVLVVDDEPDIRELLSMTLERMQLGCETAESLEQATDLLTVRKFDLCLTDMRLPDGNGIELVRQIQENYPEIPVAVITAYGNVDLAVEALKAGAFDFVSKPIKLEDLRVLVSSALKVVQQRPPDRRSRNQLLGDSKPMCRVRGMITKLARSQAPVYIRGESGTGKEMVARLIHEKGSRADHPFIAVNCGAIPQELMESEFFGHKKGSFTGAVADKPGLFQAASEGTLFLDEVAELPKPMQVKLLRAIQEKAVRPVGEQEEIGINVRILSASQVDLAPLVGKGLFRSDFYYRINVIELVLPPLRKRTEDVPVLTDYFLNRLCGTESPVRLTESAYRKLRSYSFPGNVRELENILERAIALSDSRAVDAEDIDLPESDSDDTGFRESGFHPGAEPLEAYLERIERKALAEALALSNNNKTEAAKLLGFTFRAFRYKLSKFDM